jgi:4-diphosphocytidyl-2-C-methyl-D-erythritol kinase
MLIAWQADTVVAWAPAKVNLFLEILGKRSDGYHEVATALVAVSLYDILEFKEESSGEIRLECDQPGLPTGPENLVYRAALLLRRRGATRRGAAIRLRKRIPVAAGLGGGSSDAAATLAALDKLWRLGLSKNQLMDLGAQLGSDVPFFFSTPAAWCTGRGDKVTPLELKRPLWFVLCCPSFGLTTADVYRAVTVPDQAVDSTLFLRALVDGDVEEICLRLLNRLQPAAESLRPALVEFLARLASFGPAGQMLSGSGTSMFALCRNQSEALRIAHGIRIRSEEGIASQAFIVRTSLECATDIKENNCGYHRNSH